jgi:hypothetical protein
VDSLDEPVVSGRGPDRNLHWICLYPGEFPECSKIELNKAIKDNDKLIVITTQPGCANCAEVKPIVDQSGVPYYEIMNASESCSDLRQSLGIMMIPDLIIYSNGKEKRYNPAGKFPWQIKRDIALLVNN